MNSQIRNIHPLMQCWALIFTVHYSVLTHTHSHTNTLTRMHTHTHTQAHIHSHMHTFMCTHICTGTQTHRHVTVIMTSSKRAIFRNILIHMFQVHMIYSRKFMLRKLPSVKVLHNICEWVCLGVCFPSLFHNYCWFVYVPITMNEIVRMSITFLNMYSFDLF